VIQTADLNILATRVLPTPRQLLSELPASESLAAQVSCHRTAIQRILHHEDPRLMVVVGPCSIHDTEAGLEYASHLAKLSKDVSDRLLLVMRVYFEKPRTTTGWKGLIMDPHLDGSNDIPAGLRIARAFLLKVLELGLPTATELLDPITPQYIADLICWSAIGARTTESQIHRQMASGLSMPLGFKNSTDGSVQNAINAIKAASQSQTFMGISRDGLASAVTTHGNPHCHIVLRGGKAGPNHHAKDVKAAGDALEKAGLIRALMIDCSHDNSGKKPELQPDVCEEVVRQRAGGDTSIVSVMLESNLHAGSQPFPQPVASLKRGVSITDGCIDWPTTEKLLRKIHRSLATGS
jgi:3-deoxy-7-phosphoheptulonate synthase